MTKFRQISFDSFLRWCEQVIQRFPWFFLIFTFIFTGFVAYYVYENLSINTNTSEMLSPDLPFQQNQKRIEKAFPQDAATLIFIVEGPTPEETSLAANALQNQLDSQKDRFDLVSIPTDNEFYRQNALLYLDQTELDDLAKKLTNAQPFIGHLAHDYSMGGLFDIIGLALDKRDEKLPMELDQLLIAIDNTINAQLTGNPRSLSWQNLLASDKLNMDSNRILVIAKPKLKFDEMLPADAAYSSARTAAENVMSQNSGVKVKITGETALEHEELESVTVGAKWAGIFSLVLVFVVQWIGLRSLKLLINTYVVLIMGLVITAGFAAVTVGHLNIISIAFASLYIGLGVDYAVHISLYYRERRVRNYTNEQAIHHSVKGVGSSLLLCALTTALGFLSFIPTDYSGVSELGIISGGGIFIGWLISVTVLPALFAVWPVNNPKPIHSKLAPRFIVTLPFHFSKTIRFFSILLGLGACFVLTKLSFDSNPVNLRNPNSESVSTFKELLKSQTDSPFALTTLANNLDEAKAVASKMAALPSVHEAITLADFVPSDQDEKLYTIEELNLILGNQLASFSKTLSENTNQRTALLKFNDKLKKAIADNTPNASITVLKQLQLHVESFLAQADASKDAQATYSLLEKELLGLLPFTLERLRTSLTASAFGIKDIPDYIASHWVSANGLYKIQIMPRKDLNIPENQREIVVEAQKVDDKVTGLPVANMASGDAVVKAFIQAFGSAFVAITLVLLVIYRNLRQPALILFPLILAALLTGATNVLLDNPFNYANIIALPLLLGMGIDSSILIMHRLHYNMNEDENLLQSSTTRGIIFSSITTLCSFSSLSFASHQGMASMGLLLSIGLFFTVVTSLIVLPAFSGKHV